MIELNENDIWQNGRRSSKGNQLKWKKDGFWYKADYAGYEGLTEYIISHLLTKSSLKEEEYVLYDLEEIRYRSAVFCGSKSRDFLYGDWQIITLERLFKNVYGESLSTMIYRMADPANRLRMIVEMTERATGLRSFGVYMSKMLTVDSLFLNEDRHTHNIAVLMNGRGQFRLCPIFDQGAGLLSDTTLDYPADKDIFELIPTVKSKTFCGDFSQQLDIAEELYGENIHFSFSQKDVAALLAGEADKMYGPVVTNRVREIIYQQMRKYEYLFR